MRKLLPLAALLALALPAAAAAATPAPFGRTCTAQDGVRFCPGGPSALVPSFDGVPLDVDVTVPATGAGPFPTIVMLHGLGGNKTNFESDSPAGGYNNVYFARRGYAVVNSTARGYAGSCGPALPHTGACAKGWTHLADQRYEVRDVQYMLGLLVDQKVADAGALGVTGISYGGGQSQELARLRDRVRLQNGQLVPWQSPQGVPLSLRAAWPRWGWSDLTYSLTPNGRFADFRDPTPRQSRNPIGVEKASYVNGLYALNAISSYLSRPGLDPGADLTTWRENTNAGEPYRAAARGVARELTTFHSATSLGGIPAPMLLENGWTDDLFPAPEALRVYDTYDDVKRAHVTLQLGDLGHARGSNKPNADDVFNRQGSRFLDAWLKGQGRKPRHDAVTAFTQTCPKARPEGGPFRARTWPALHPGAFEFGSRRAQRVTSGGGDPAVGHELDPIAQPDACHTVAAAKAKGTATYQRRTRFAYTLLGLPTVRATIRTKGMYGELAARLWDVHRGRRLLVSRGIYRLKPNQQGRIAFQLFGNGWKFRRGHVARLELLGSDPDYLRPSNGTFSVRIRNVTVSLPTRDKPGKRRGIVAPDGL
jgi:predicted acyl esterase